MSKEQSKTEVASFVHDGPCCTFLGTFRGGVPVMDYDLYWCDQGVGLPTVIARYGDEGSAYASGLSGSARRHTALIEAKRRGSTPPSATSQANLPDNRLHCTHA